MGMLFPKVQRDKVEQQSGIVFKKEESRIQNTTFVKSHKTKKNPVFEVDADPS